MTPTRLRRLAAVAVLTLFAFGACGSDSDGESSADNTDSSSSSSSKSGDEAAGGAATEGDTVDIVDFNYAPPNLKVKVGTEVTFTNKDDFAHTVTANDKSFDSKNMDKDAVFKHTFEKAGTFDYICAIHNSMTGKVTVE